MPASRVTSELDRFLALLDISESLRSKSDTLAQAFYGEIRALAKERPTKAAIRSLEHDLLVQWNEGVGPEVEAFWERVIASELLRLIT